jgi:hypothetical protein
MPSSRPAIPTEVRREVLFEARHHCAVCCAALPLEYAHIVPWRMTRDHSVEDLIALCANCHERADNEKWGISYLKRYKVSPCILARGVPALVSPEQKALIDLIVARDRRDMSDHERERLVSIVAAYAGVSIADISVISVEPLNSARVCLFKTILGATGSCTSTLLAILLPTLIPLSPTLVSALEAHLRREMFSVSSSDFDSEADTATYLAFSSPELL